MSKDRTELIDGMAAALEEILPQIYGKKMGFALFMFPFNTTEEAGDYVSNVGRDTMIKFIRDTADRLERGKSIGRPIGEA